MDLDNFGQRVAETRTARGQSYRDVARETGVLISTLHKVEHGGDPRLSTIKALLPWLAADSTPRKAEDL